MTDLSFELLGGDLVCTIVGPTFDDDVLDQVTRLTQNRMGPLIIDLRDLAMSDDATAAVIPDLIRSCAADCVVVRRETGRRLPTRLLTGHGCAVFTNLDDARTISA